MQKMFNKTRDSFFLSNYIRIIFCFAIFSVLTIQLYAQWVDAYIPDFKVNDDVGISYQVNSQIAVDSAGNFVIVWNDARRFSPASYPYDIYCQRYDKFGNTFGNNFRLVNQDSVILGGITIYANGIFVVTWSNTIIRNQTQYYELFFQKFDKVANPINLPTKVIDTTYLADFPISLQGMSISSDSLGRFVICWAKAHTVNSKIQVFFQRFDSSGTKLGDIDSVS